MAHLDRFFSGAFSSSIGNEGSGFVSSTTTKTYQQNTMAAEKHWYMNGHSLFETAEASLLQIFSNCHSKHRQKEAIENGMHHYQMNEPNNNSDMISEMEAHVIEILSTNDQCTLVDIRKRLPAVTSPKVVENTMDSLQSKGLVKHLNSRPQTWTLTPQYKCGEDLNGMAHFHGRGRSFSDIIPYRNFVQQDGLHLQERGSRQVSITMSSRSFQNGSSAFYRQRKVPEITRDATTKRCRPRGLSFSEGGNNDESFYGLKMHPFDIDSFVEISKRQSFNDGFDLTKRHDHHVALDEFPTGNVKNAHKQKERSPIAYYKRDPGVIGEGRTIKHNPRSKSLEETGFCRNQLNSGDCNRNNGEMRPRSKSFGPLDGDTKSCSLCKIPFSTKQQLEEHFQSTKHQNKIAKVTSDPYSKFCDYCKVGLNSKSQAKEHFSSARHEQTVAKSQKAPIRDHLPMNFGSKVFHPRILTVTQPQDYQVELYMKAMCTNSVCFLPTGAGNNLVSALIVAHLLHLNPTRQVIFLVDRVLLVVQQSDYLKFELKNMEIPHSAKNDDQITAPRFGGQYQNHGFKRPIRIGAICGEMRKLEPGIPVFSHDILVVTADCYRNHVSNGTLRFEDSALIVLDESHHCNKDHPYNVIIRDHYLPDEIPLYDRPKILGLTASPAGEPTLDRTVKKIQRLLSNLGGATLLPVSLPIQELIEKTNQSDIVCHRVEYTPNEKVLLGALMEYATKCFNLAARVSEFKEYKDVFQPSSGGMLSKEDIVPVLEVLDKFVNLSKPRNKSFNSLLHFQTICEAICALQECGEKLALDRMMDLVYDSSYGFEWAMEQGLPCDDLKSYLEQCSSEVSIVEMGSSVYELVDVLNGKIINEDKRISSSLLALIIVRRNQTAVGLAKYLDSCHLLHKGIRTTALAGYETTRSYAGNPSEKSETLSKIHQGVYQIVVATSVNEEVLALPASRLVVQLDPPNAVNALVQIRSYFRETNTTFAVISRDGNFPKKVKDLLLRENNMIQAVQAINSNDYMY